VEGEGGGIDLLDDLKFEDIKGITPSIASKLRKNNITTVEKLAMASIEELKEILKGTPENKIREMQIEVWKALGYWYIPANMISQVGKQPIVFSTGCKALNEILEGGIRSRILTEFCGEYGAGKTESLLTILVENMAKKTDYTAIFYDSEETFNEQRVAQIAKARGYDPEEIFRKTLLLRVWNTQHFIEAIKQADGIIKERNVKLILIDSIIATLRSEYIGRETLAARQHLLNKMLRMLLNYAKAFNLAVVMTNQVSDNPQQVYYTQDPTTEKKPTGGNILAHNAETRIFLRKAAKPTVRIARIIDSSWLPPRECVFQITEAGITDLEESQAQP